MNSENHIRTHDLVERSQYFDSPDRFFANFPAAWHGVAERVLKLETRQEYCELGNPSYEALQQGDWNEAIRLIPEFRAQDADLYESLKKRGVEFIRARPIALPLSQYLRWEFETYKESIKMGEHIFCCDAETTEDLFREFASHDFMVFDGVIALIHDYDECGLIQGGWAITDPHDVLSLAILHSHIVSLSRPFAAVAAQAAV